MITYLYITTTKLNHGHIEHIDHVDHIDTIDHGDVDVHNHAF